MLLTYLLTYSLTHPPTHSLTHSLTFFSLSLNTFYLCRGLSPVSEACNFTIKENPVNIVKFPVNIVKFFKIIFYRTPPVAASGAYSVIIFENNYPKQLFLLN